MAHSSEGTKETTPTEDDRSDSPGTSVKVLKPRKKTLGMQILNMHIYCKMCLYSHGAKQKIKKGSEQGCDEKSRLQSTEKNAVVDVNQNEKMYF